MPQVITIDALYIVVLCSINYCFVPVPVLSGYHYRGADNGCNTHALPTNASWYTGGSVNFTNGHDSTLKLIKNTSPGIFHLFYDTRGLALGTCIYEKTDLCGISSLY